jgi:hypothetical protein
MLKTDMYINILEYEISFIELLEQCEIEYRGLGEDFILDEFIYYVIRENSKIV